MNRNAVIFTIGAAMLLAAYGFGEETQTVYLSGKGKDDAVSWEFFCTAGRNSGRWTTIPVPSCWELQGFGTYNYGHDAEKATEDGKYRQRFDVPAAWEGKRAFIVFEGAMTDTEAWINGHSVGPKHQGAFYQFQYDVTGLLKYGAQNLLEVTVSKDSADETVNAAERQADYWIFGGLFRPVYLKVLPASFIERTAIDAKADGSFAIDVYLGGIAALASVEAQIESSGGAPIGKPVTAEARPGDDKVRLTTTVSKPQLWTAETPNLYRVKVALKCGERVHTVMQPFGFRTIEVRAGDGIYVNGRKVMLKGVDRHSFWPDSGRTTSEALSKADVATMKAMNMNAVRMSHYPPDGHFLDACDEAGLYVLDELAGWQAPPYATPIGKKLVREMIMRDVNHPSIIFWDNGNEGGTNPEVDGDFWLYDPQRRPILHPYMIFSGVDTAHYPDYATLGKKLAGSTIYLPTEFLHGLYDGGMGAGLEDFWNLMRESPLSAGGFLWDFADEGVKRTDRNGALDTDGNHAPDGILGPYHEKEASFYTVREIWSPIAPGFEQLPPDFDGKIPFENCYDFTNADRCTFEWQLALFRPPTDREAGHTVVAQGVAPAPSVAPGARGVVALPLPADWRTADALFLTVKDPAGRLLHEWSFPIRTAAEHLQQLVKAASGNATGREIGDDVEMTAAGITVRISKTSGKLSGVRWKDRPISFGNGPIIAGKNLSASLLGLKHYADGPDYVVEANYSGNLRNVTWRMRSSGWLEMSYRGWTPNRDNHPDHDFFGLNFSYPEAKVVGMKWLGKGPYRVWKNRLRGLTTDVWEKPYNDTETGVTWDYPEFKGYHGDVHWAVIKNTEADFTVVTEDAGLFLRVFTPRFSDAGYATAPFPDGDISFLKAIAPIGNKFQPAAALGPQGERSLIFGDFSGKLCFYFGGEPSRRP